MTPSDFVKNLFVPLISVGTAVMVGILNFQVSQNDLELRQRDQELEQKLSEIDLVIKKSREEREERESNQDFNLKIYEIVTESLEENSAQKQDAARAFVVVMVDEPLRSSLLNVLKQGGSPMMKREINKILQAEQKFQNVNAWIPKVERKVTSSHSWGNWDFDIFWCTSSGEEAKIQAQMIAEQLKAEDAKGRIRVRELPDSINAKSSYQVNGYNIRRNTNEIETANALKQLGETALSNNDISTEFTISTSRQNTPWYISAFVCPRN